MIHVAIIDDHPVVRAGLREFLSGHTDIQVAAEGANGHDAIDIARGEQIDVMVLDIAMPECSGVDALVAIQARNTGMPVLMFSEFSEAHYAMALLRQGASGYLNKCCDRDELTLAIRTVSRGRKYISVCVAEQLAEGWAIKGQHSPHLCLSEREFQVFLRLARGDTVGHTADGMSLSVKTVSTYRARVMEKLKLGSNSDLTYYAMKNGLIQ